jgi:hypothetical protein
MPIVSVSPTQKTPSLPPLPVYKASIDEDMTSDLEVNFIGLVDRPAIDRNFQAFKAQTYRLKFAVDDQLKIISGPAMIADMPLYRKDDQLGEYYVMFDKPAIQTIVEKFSAKGYLQKFNLFHDDQQQVSDVTIFNSFITNKKLGINPPVGFEDIAEGSWFISAKVNNDAVWSRVKEGVIKGFSVEGLFSYLPAKTVKVNARIANNQIKLLLSTVKPGKEGAMFVRILQVLENCDDERYVNEKLDALAPVLATMKSANETGN